ncbi:MAG: replication-associated recombination protein A [Desulfovibrionaceae bacterium]
MGIELTEKQPLADRIRPRTLDEFVGQPHLRKRIDAFMKAKRLPSLLLFGPPGCGKSTLAMLLAQSRSRNLLRVSAPEAGLQALRRSLSGVEVLVLDELHRFSKAQQDFFLPMLESGAIVLLATTTENPSFSVTRQLLSRLHVLRLRTLSREELLEIAGRGQKELKLELEEESVKMLVAMAGGDGRSLLNLLEHAASLDAEQRKFENLRQSLPEVMLRGDKDGDFHYEYVSAMIKSIRGADPDAAIYYMACMLEAGQDPRFIARRLVIAAAEDIGLADPQALPLAVACQQAVEFVGMPEGRIPLAETVVYLALAPKSNSTYAAYQNAQKEIRQNGPLPTPLHLRNAATALQKEWGYGRGYKYPHSYPGAWIEQEYMPEPLAGRVFYYQKDQGAEPKINAWRRLRTRKKT